MQIHEEFVYFSVPDLRSSGFREPINEKDTRVVMRFQRDILNQVIIEYRTHSSMVRYREEDIIPPE